MSRYKLSEDFTEMREQTMCESGKTSMEREEKE